MEPRNNVSAGADVLEATEGCMDAPCLPGALCPAEVEEQGMLTLGLSRNLGGPIPSTSNLGRGEAEPEFSWPASAVSRCLHGANPRARWWYSAASTSRCAGRGSGVGASRSSGEAGERARRADPVERRACRRQGLQAGTTPGTLRPGKPCHRDACKYGVGAKGASPP